MPLKPTFDSLDLEASEHLAALSRVINCAKMFHNLRQTIRLGWPSGIWDPGSFAISAQALYRTYAHDKDPAKLSPKTATRVVSLRELELELDEARSLVVESELIHAMSMAIFGLN